MQRKYARAMKLANHETEFAHVRLDETRGGAFKA